MIWNVGHLRVPAGAQLPGGGPAEKGLKPNALSLVANIMFGVASVAPAYSLALPVAQAFPLAEAAQAHRASEQGHVRGKLVLLAG